MKRRVFLQTSAALCAAAPLAALAEPESHAAPVPKMPDSSWSAIRGFNYSPSYGSNGFELWQNFNAPQIERELERGKRYFPHIMALRWWQSWDSFNRAPQRYAADFETSLALAAKFGLRVMPVLFNRWHDKVLDYGGIYIDHFLPRSSWLQRRKMFGPFLEAIVGRHQNDERILAWDLCNEPFSYSRPFPHGKEIPEAEFAWLRALYENCKQLGAKAPLTIGTHPGDGSEGIAQIEPISDVLSIHPYWRPNKDRPGDHERLLDMYVDFALKAKKPLLATETCWGELDDAKRVDIIRYTLGELKRRNIGWLAHLMHHSLIADAHRPEFGPVGTPGNLSFIEADGSLRPGHGVFNEF